MANISDEAEAQANGKDVDNVPGSTEKAKSAGSLVFCGSNKWDLIGRKSIPKKIAQRGGSEAGSDIFSPTRLKFQGCPSKFVSVYSGCVAAHAILVDEEGKAWGIGRNDYGQLGVDDLVSKRIPVKIDIPEEEKVVSVACGRNHTLMLMESGAVYACGNNISGQLGTKKSENDLAECGELAKAILNEKVVSVAAGNDFSVFISEKGEIYTCGNAQYGQIGLGVTGERIGKANRISYGLKTTPFRLPGFGSEKGETRIVEAACGAKHTIVRDSDHKVWSWGFGGYGRLGHEGPKDELRPRAIEKFQVNTYYRADYITCGDSSSYAANVDKDCLYMWGVTKKNGEATMYPKPNHELQGWKVRSMGCGPTSTVIASEKSVISWGPSPTYGELGYGDSQPKSSTKPKLMDSMEGLCVKQIAEGMAFTFMIVKVDSEEEKKIFDALPELTIEADVVGTKRKSSSTAKKGKGGRKSRKS